MNHNFVLCKQVSATDLDDLPNTDKKAACVRKKVPCQELSEQIMKTTVVLNIIWNIAAGTCIQSSDSTLCCLNSRQ